MTVQLYYDLLVLTDIARSLPPDSAAGMDALYIANRAVSTARSGNLREGECRWHMCDRSTLRNGLEM